LRKAFIEGFERGDTGKSAALAERIAKFNTLDVPMRSGPAPPHLRPVAACGCPGLVSTNRLARQLAGLMSSGWAATPPNPEAEFSDTLASAADLPVSPRSKPLDECLAQVFDAHVAYEVRSSCCSVSESMKPFRIVQWLTTYSAATYTLTLRRSPCVRPVH